MIIIYYQRTDTSYYILLISLVVGSTGTDGDAVIIGRQVITYQFHNS